MALRSDDMVVGSRWVYVLDIDCHGAGTLLYPINYTENRFPNGGANQNKFVLPHSLTLRIGPPFGVDTLILLSTEQPLPDPYVLNFEGVASRGARGAGSPLEQLLSNRSSGSTRGVAGGDADRLGNVDDAPAQCAEGGCPVRSGRTLWAQPNPVVTPRLR